MATNAPGTIAWAGGPIDWSSNAPDIAANGYYYAQFESVTVDCYNATTAPGTNLHNSYTYNNIAGTNNTVVDGTGNTILKSFLGTGTNMSAVLPSASSGAPAATSQVNVVPGLSGGGPGVDSHGDGSNAGTTAANAPAATMTGFGQFSGSTPGGKSEGSTLSNNKQMLVGGTILACAVAAGAMLVL